MDVRNTLLDKFFKTFQLDKEQLLEFCLDQGITDSSKIIEEFERIRTDIFDYIWEITKPNKRLSPIEIIAESDNFFQNNYQWIDKNGKKAVNNYLFWMCWHEGIIK